MSRTKDVQCPVTAPHGRGESHATVLRGAYLTRGGIGVEEAEELVIQDTGDGLSQKVSNIRR